MARYFLDKSDLIEDLLLDIFSNKLYLLPPLASPEEIEPLYHDLTHLEHYALVIPSQWLLTHSTTSMSLLQHKLIAAVLQLQDSKFSLLLFSPKQKTERTLLCSFSLQQLDAQLASKISGCYRRFRVPSQPSVETSSPVCYASQFPEPTTGVLVDGLAFVAGAKEFAANNYSLNPQAYL